MKHFILLSWLLVSFLIMRNEALAGPGLCRVTTLPPSLAANRDVPCSIDANGNIRFTPGTVSAGERNPNSSSNSYLVVRQETNATIISKTTAVTLGGGVANDSHLMGLHILAPLTGTCVVSGFADSDGTAQSFTVPVAATGFKDFFGMTNSAGALTITCSNVADDNLVVALWRLR